MNQPRFQMGADARLLLQRIRTAYVGEVLTYAMLGNTISKRVDGSFGALRTAINRAMKDDDMVFAAVPGVGIKRLTDQEILGQGAADAESIRRRARRSIEKQMKIDFSKLDRGSQMRFTAQVSTMATIAMMSKPKSLDTLAASTSPGQKQLPVNETLRMFAGLEARNAPSNKE